MYDAMCAWGSEDNFWESCLSFDSGSRAWTQGIRLSRQGIKGQWVISMAPVSSPVNPHWRNSTQSVREQRDMDTFWWCWSSARPERCLLWWWHLSTGSASHRDVTWDLGPSGADWGWARRQESLVDWVYPEVTKLYTFNCCCWMFCWKEVGESFRQALNVVNKHRETWIQLISFLLLQ